MLNHQQIQLKLHRKLKQLKQLKLLKQNQNKIDFLGKPLYHECGYAPQRQN